MSSATDVQQPSRHVLWTMLFCLLVGFPIGAVPVWFWLTPKNVASRYIQIRPARPRLLFETADNQRSGTTCFQTFKQTQNAIILQPSLLQAAIRDFSSDELYELSGEIPDRQITWLQENIEVSFPNDGQIMAVTMKSPDEEPAIKIVNAIVDEYEREIVTNLASGSEERLVKLREVYERKALDVRHIRETIKQLAAVTGMTEDGKLNFVQESNLELWRKLQAEMVNTMNERRKLAGELSILKKLEAAIEKRRSTGSDKARSQLQRPLRPKPVPVAEVLVSTTTPSSERRIAKLIVQSTQEAESETDNREELLKKFAELEPSTVLQARLVVLSELEAELRGLVDRKRDEVRSYGQQSVDVEMLKAELAAEEEVLAEIRKEKDRSEIEKEALPQITVSPPISDASLESSQPQIWWSIALGAVGFLVIFLLFVIHWIRAWRRAKRAGLTATRMA